MRAIGFGLGLCFVACSTPAFAGAYYCDRPGTPNPVRAYPLNASTIEMLITNTAKEGATRTIVYEIEDKQGKVIRFGAMLPAGEAIPYDITGLAANATYTYRVWTRDDNDQGCRSEQPSGWVSAMTRPPYSAKVYLPGDGPGCGPGSGLKCPVGGSVGAGGGVPVRSGGGGVSRP